MFELSYRGGKRSPGLIAVFAAVLVALVNPLPAQAGDDTSLDRTWLASAGTPQPAVLLANLTGRGVRTEVPSPLTRNPRSAVILWDELKRPRPAQPRPRIGTLQSEPPKRSTGHD